MLLFKKFQASYGQQIPAINDGYTFINLNFDFEYFETVYNEVTISTMGYVCLGKNKACNIDIRPTIHDILVGLNYGLDTSRNGSGQIYYKSLRNDSTEFRMARIYVNLFSPTFIPYNIFMITYDQVLSYDKTSNGKASFQVFLLANFLKSYAIFKFIQCPAELTLKASSGLNHKASINNASTLKEITIDNGQQCTSSNVGQTGIWVIEVTNLASGNYD